MSFDYRFGDKFPKRAASRSTAERGRGLKRGTLRYTSLASFLPSVLSCGPPGSTIARACSRTCLSPDLTGTLLSIADTQHSEEDTYAMRRLLSPRHFAAAATVTTAAAAATATVAQLQTPEEYVSDPPLGPWASGPRHARAHTRACVRPRAKCVSALICFCVLARNNMHATPSDAHCRYISQRTTTLSTEKGDMSFRISRGQVSRTGS